MGMISVLLVAAFAEAQPKPAPVLPDTESAKRVAAWLAAFNTGDDAAMRKYLAENLAPEAIERRPVEERLGMFRDMRSAFGSVELRKVVKAEEGLVTVVFAISEGFVKLNFEFEPQRPHRLLRIFGEPAEDPDLPPPRSRGDLGWDGGAPGIGAVLRADLATGYTVIVLTNYDPDAVEAVAKTIRRILSGVMKS
jgi:hypothetical protein